jgi:hypothetical protein
MSPLQRNVLTKIIVTIQVSAKNGVHQVSENNGRLGGGGSRKSARNTITKESSQSRDESPASCVFMRL